MKKLESRRLVLNKEVVRTLGDRKLEGVLGGAPETADWTCKCIDTEDGCGCSCARSGCGINTNAGGV